MKEKIKLDRSDLIAILCILGGLTASGMVWMPGGGLGLTNLNNTFVFGAWIIADLTLIGLGSAAFCTAALYHLFKRAHLRPLLPISIATGLLCYGTAGFILLLEIGQPLRFWFPFRHPNFISMLTEITFCISLYSFILLMEFLPLLCRHARLNQVGFILSLRQKLALLLPALAVAGAAVSFMHQGSLGGIYGVMSARPFAWRPGLGIWPWTCLLFIISAMAAGPLFMSLLVGVIEKAAKIRVLTGQMLDTLGRFAAVCLGISLLARLTDILLWKYWLLPERGLAFDRMFHGAAFGKWLLAAELGAFTLLPLLLLANRRLRTKRSLFFWSGGLACFGLLVNRYVVNLQTMAVPTLPFEGWESYHPNWVELAPLLMTAAVFFLGLKILLRQGILFSAETEKDFRNIKDNLLQADLASEKVVGQVSCKGAPGNLL
ncbi:MAG: polysulfide reductase NrfD [Desulfovibrionaceae bacterium]|nr:polysulfide reductase NrfD [Desulfovibrionaceae bacterium]